MSLAGWRLPGDIYLAFWKLSALDFEYETRWIIIVRFQKGTWKVQLISRVMGGPSIEPVADGSCKKVKNVDVLSARKSLVKHTVDGIQRSINFQTSTCNELPVQNSSWTVIYRYPVHFSDEQGRFTSSWPKRDVPFFLMYRSLWGRGKLSTIPKDEDQVLSYLILLGNLSLPFHNKGTSSETFSNGMVIGYKNFHVPFVLSKQCRLLTNLYLNTAHHINCP